ncbi:MULTISPECIES: hypothetical protein [Streptomyces]|uniref:hypothetical protein n=1 Tax=Streptomyces TaxID=1883 RepID=UPI00163C24FC|nr:MULTISPECIES: hypothetical protein [Streptomyces]MBC2873961.1 hypothetical protein [Streptomyces sp. TYQ1024]UBI39096.1 hypothetical protein K7I03_23345 [Streptomyces mobaraensis]UKW31675.1 hypothetical protein MCU78_23290 [Streptomyces sp. TYQ1024]
MSTSSRRRAARPALVLAAALALTAGLATTAPAASGEFIYQSRATGFTRTFVDPMNNVCLFFEFGANKMVNSTNRTARVYLGGNCGEGGFADIPKGGTKTVTLDDFHSVKFL